MEKKILIDTDGILRDFIGGLEKHKNIIFDFSSGKNVQSQLGMLHDAFVNDLDDWRFWKGLKPTQEAGNILRTIKKYFPSQKKIFIVSSSYQTPNILAGCQLWYEKWLPNLVRRNKIIYIKNKYLLANKDTILLDDHTNACKDFSNHGGWAILFSRPWNINYRTVNPFERFENELKMILNVTEVGDGKKRVSPVGPFI